MRMPDTVTRLLGAAILLVAVLLLPSLAQAHGDHALSAMVTPGDLSPRAHAHAAHTASTPVASAPSAPSPSRLAPLAARAGLTGPSEPAGPCENDCCMPGMRCCISALSSDVPLPLPLPTLRRQDPLRTALMPPGHRPEALPKPPRRLA